MDRWQESSRLWGQSCWWKKGPRFPLSRLCGALPSPKAKRSFDKNRNNYGNALQCRWVWCKCLKLDSGRLAALCRLQQLSFCAEAWTKHPTLTAKLGSSLLSKQWSQEVDESGGKDRGSCGTNSVPRNKYAGAVIHQGSVSKDLPLSWQKDKIGGSVWPLERRRKRKRFLPSPHPAHTGEP